MLKQRSWKTTLAGLSSIMSGLGQIIYAITDGNPQTNPDWGTSIPLIITGIGLIFARDNDKSSRDIGIIK